MCSGWKLGSGHRQISTGGHTAMASHEPKDAKQPWRRPSLTYVGHVGDVLQGGGGKLTPSPADPGEIRKPKGGGG